VGTTHVVGNEDLCAPVPSRTTSVAGKPSNSSDTGGNCFVFIVERERHRPHLALIGNESAGFHHLNCLCHTAGDTQPKKSHQDHGWGILGPSPSDYMLSHPLLTGFDALYLGGFFPRNPSVGIVGFSSQSSSKLHSPFSSRNPHINLCLHSLAFLGLNSTM